MPEMYVVLIDTVCCHNIYIPQNLWEREGGGERGRERESLLSQSVQQVAVKAFCLQPQTADS